MLYHERSCTVEYDTPILQRLDTYDASCVIIDVHLERFGICDDKMLFSSNNDYDDGEEENENENENDNTHD